MKNPRCWYKGCPRGYQIAEDDEEVTCSMCRYDLDLPPLYGPETDEVGEYDADEEGPSHV